MFNNYPKIKEYDILEENVRERCIYEVIGDKRNDDDEHVFFNYLYNMKKECLEKKGTIKESCSRNVMWELEIDWSKVEKCMNHSFTDVEERGEDNILLQRDRLHANELGVHQVPALAINSHRYRGEMKGEDIFQSICASYRVNAIPTVCTE